jgi:DNA replication protein DnaC
MGELITERITANARELKLLGLAPHLLICDEVGYLSLELADANRVFQVINRRYTRSSTIVTSNKRVTDWGTRLGDEILDTTASQNTATA